MKITLSIFYFRLTENFILFCFSHVFTCTNFWYLFNTFLHYHTHLLFISANMLYTIHIHYWEKQTNYTIVQGQARKVLVYRYLPQMFGKFVYGF